jgi:hypothetical protein
MRDQKPNGDGGKGGNGLKIKPLDGQTREQRVRRTSAKREEHKSHTCEELSQINIENKESELPFGAQVLDQHQQAAIAALLFRKGLLNQKPPSM